MSIPHRTATSRLGPLAVVSLLTAAFLTTGGGGPGPIVQAKNHDPSGQTVPTRDLAGWKHIYADDFPTDVSVGAFPDAMRDKWRVYPAPWRDSSKKGTYSPKKTLSVKDGVLTKNIRSENGRHMVAALVPKVPGSEQWGQLYGRYSVRMRADRFTGYKIAWLLWPDTGTVTTGSASGVGGNGEIDWPEAELFSANTYGYIHHQDAVVGNDQVRIKAPVIDRRQWHTYTIEWSPDLVVLYLDGKEVGRTTKRIPNTPMHWVLQTETSIRHSTPSTSKGKVQVDWVSAWAYDPATVPAPPSKPAPPKPAPADPTTGTNGPARDIWVSWPADGATVDHDSPLKFDGRRTDVTAVKWYVDGKERAYDGRGPTFQDVWDTNVLPDGRHRVFAKARLSDGTWITTRTRVFTIDNR